jgi:hypothetical protein
MMDNIQNFDRYVNIPLSQNLDLSSGKHSLLLIDLTLYFLELLIA